MSERVPEKPLPDIAGGCEIHKGMSGEVAVILYREYGNGGNKEIVLTNGVTAADSRSEILFKKWGRKDSVLEVAYDNKGGLQEIFVEVGLDTDTYSVHLKRVETDPDCFIARATVEDGEKAPPDIFHFGRQEIYTYNFAKNTQFMVINKEGSMFLQTSGNGEVLLARIPEEVSVGRARELVEKREGKEREIKNPDWTKLPECFPVFVVYTQSDANHTVIWHIGKTEKLKH